MSREDTIRFVATLPPINTAIQFHGEHGARIMLDVPDEFAGEVAQLLRLRGCQIEVEIREN